MLDSEYSVIKSDVIKRFDCTHLGVSSIQKVKGTYQVEIRFVYCWSMDDCKSPNVAIIFS